MAKETKQTALDIKALKGIAIAAAESVFHYKLIARAINRDEDTILAWRKDDPDFSDALEQGRHRFIEKNIKAAKPEFLLERLDSELFKQRTESEVKIELPKPILGSASKK